MNRPLHFVARTVALATFFLGLFLSSFASAESSRVDVITVQGIIDPIAAGYVERGIATAEMDQARCIIIELDTPGGLDTSMRRIVQKILNARIPVIVYVAPSGARAASAGVFITAAANIAAMAPGTNLGAAHPVGTEGELPETLSEKATNDAAAYIKSIAEERGRNAEWLQDAVRRSVSAPAREALELGVVDLIAPSLEELLREVDGRSVNTVIGESILDTKSVKIFRTDMNFAERLLHIIVDPNIAYVLLSLGTLGILIEFFHPGAIFPGAAGAICLILAFVAFGSLPLNWAGAGLILLAGVLIALELVVPGFGALTAAAVASFIVGSLLLYTPLVPTYPSMPEIQVSRWLIGGIAACMAALSVFVFSAAISSRRARVVTGPQTLIGLTGITTSNLSPVGTVQVASELWSAVAEGEEVIKAGDKIEVVAVEGLILRVRKAQ